MTSFHRYNDFDESDYWTLYVNIYPQENRINFKSECEIVTETEKSYEYDLTSSREMSRTGDKKTLPQNLVDGVEKVFDYEMPEEVESVGFTFDAKWGAIYLNHFEIDGYKDQTRLGPWHALLDNIMSHLVDRWWDEEAGMEGEITIERGKSIKIDCEFRSEEYEYQPKITQEFIKRQKQLKKRISLGEKDIDHRAFLIMDDCLYDNDWKFISLQ